MAKKQYYFSNSNFYSSLKEKKLKRKKLFLYTAGCLFLIALVFVGFKWIVQPAQNNKIISQSESTTIGNRIDDQAHQSVNDLEFLTKENFFEEISDEKTEEKIILAKNPFLEEIDPGDANIGASDAQEKIENEIVEEKDEGITVNGCLEAGDTLYDSLIKEGINAVEILELQEKLKSVIDCNQIPIGAKYTLKYNPEGELKEFIYETSPLDVLHINILDSEYNELEIHQESIDKTVVKLEGIIKSSLYESMMECADSPQLAIQIADIFGWQIDFLTECREGDTFKILVEKQHRGDFYRWGKVLAAQYEGEHLSTHTAVLFEDPSGHIDYYNEKGESLRKAFLRAPLNYKYISSYFSKNRLHPILRIWRPHLAIDYAAPTGTPISTIGDGSVIFAGWKSGYGNYIQIRHPNNYVTGYGHLSRFANGLKKGKKVVQGEVIGYVGATGLATGPHLDFSISKNGERIDFLKLKLPSASSVDSQYMDQFEEVKNELIAQLEREEEMDLFLTGR